MIMLGTGVVTLPLMSSAIVVCDPTRAVPSTRTTGSSTRVLSIGIGGLVRAWLAIKPDGISVVLIFLVLN